MTDDIFTVSKVSSTAMTWTQVIAHVHMLDEQAALALVPEDSQRYGPPLVIIGEVGEAYGYYPSTSFIAAFGKFEPVDNLTYEEAIAGAKDAFIARLSAK